MIKNVARPIDQQKLGRAEKILEKLPFARSAEKKEKPRR